MGSQVCTQFSYLQQLKDKYKYVSETKNYFEAIGSSLKKCTRPILISLSIPRVYITTFSFLDLLACLLRACNMIFCAASRVEKKRNEKWNNETNRFQVQGLHILCEREAMNLVSSGTTDVQTRL